LAYFRVWRRDQIPKVSSAATLPVQSLSTKSSSRECQQSHLRLQCKGARKRVSSIRTFMCWHSNRSMPPLRGHLLTVSSGVVTEPQPGVTAPKQPHASQKKQQVCRFFNSKRGKRCFSLNLILLLEIIALVNVRPRCVTKPAATSVSKYHLLTRCGE
jgi:hypothetical protein